MRTCDKCGKANPDEASYCLSCGTKLPSIPENKCPVCGHVSPADARYCGACRASLSPQVAPAQQAAPPPSSPSVQDAPSYQSGVSNVWQEAIVDQSAEAYARPTGLTVAGILLLVAGAAAIIDGIYSLGMASTVSEYDAGELGVVDLSGYVMCCASLAIIFGVAGLAGGYFTMTQQKWNLAFVGSILVMLALGPFMVCLVFGLIALILVALGRDSFFS